MMHSGIALYFNAKMNGTNGIPMAPMVLPGEALISQLEVEQFGRNGDAGPFGCEPNSDPTYGDPPRTFVPRAIHAFQVLIR